MYVWESFVHLLTLHLSPLAPTRTEVERVVTLELVSKGGKSRTIDDPLTP